MTGLLETEETVFSDNTIHEMLISTFQTFHVPSCISSRKIVSFVILNVPEDEQELMALDSDGDTLNDHQELYVTFTSPFLTDTDDDGVADDVEVAQGTDPNDYLDPAPTGGPPGW